MEAAGVVDLQRAALCCVRWTSWTVWELKASRAAGQGPQGRVRRLHTGRRPGAAQIDRFLAFSVARRHAPGNAAACPTSRSTRRVQLEKEESYIDAILKAMGIDEHEVTFDPSIVRGLEYYTALC
jgi:hypothetical protein